MSLADDILGADDIKRIPVNLPEWGVSGQVETWNGTKQADLYSRWRKWREEHGGTDADKFYKAFVVCNILLDSSGTRIFTDDHVLKVAQKSARMIELVIYAGDKLNALTDDAAEKLLKNSDATPTENSGLNSPSVGVAQ